MMISKLAHNLFANGLASTIAGFLSILFLHKTTYEYYAYVW